MSGTPQRATARQCDRVDRHGSALVHLVTTVRLAVVDGSVDPDEATALERAIASAQRTHRVVEVGADRIDNGARLVLLLAATLELTPWADRQLREIAEEQAWAVLEGGLSEDDEPEAA